MIKKSSVKCKLRENKLVIRTFLRFANPSAAEIMVLAGVDLIVVDNEHYEFSLSDIQSIQRAVDCVGGEMLVRVPDADPAFIGQVMDVGVLGIMVPSVDSYEEALEIVKAVKFEPEGKRGFCPIVRAANYGIGVSYGEFAQKANNDTMILIQIETKSGVDDLDRILTIPEIDIIGIGPSDLSASFGHIGHPEHPEIQAIIKEVKRKVLASGKVLSVQAYTPEAVILHRKEGANCLNIGSDLQFISNGTRALIAAIPENTK